MGQRAEGPEEKRNDSLRNRVILVEKKWFCINQEKEQLLFSESFREYRPIDEPGNNFNK